MHFSSEVGTNNGEFLLINYFFKATTVNIAPHLLGKKWLSAV
jgi:hypothetical protein